MRFLEYFQTELNNNNVNYFIFDSKGDASVGDIDFVKYSWETTRYNKVRTGDLVIFRRPGKASETKQFYFFGAAKIGAITGQGRVTAALIKVYPFVEYLHQEDLDSFQWSFKKRGKTWEHFFNQYGMNQVTKADFIALLSLADVAQFDFDPLSAATAIQSIQRENFAVDDSESLSKVRTKQNVFSNKVKNNYRNRCAVCGMSTRDFLIGSHIIPWSVNKLIRLDPSNGISLCSFHDKAFDRGYFSLDNNFKIYISQRDLHDAVLRSLLIAIDGNKISLPSRDLPKLDYLEYHRNSIFEQF